MYVILTARILIAHRTVWSVAFRDAMLVGNAITRRCDLIWVYLSHFFVYILLTDHVGARYRLSRRSIRFITTFLLEYIPLNPDGSTLAQVSSIVSVCYRVHFALRKVRALIRVTRAVNINCADMAFYLITCLSLPLLLLLLPLSLLPSLSFSLYLTMRIHACRRSRVGQTGDAFARRHARALSVACVLEGIPDGNVHTALSFVSSVAYAD